MKSSSHIPTIGIVGRPNVGKSSLFNRLLGERKAVVIEQSGTTRDKIEAVVNIKGRAFKLVDTGGYMAHDADELALQIKEQIYSAMEEADLLIMVADAMDGLSPMDEEVAFILRKYGKPVILVANKSDNKKIEKNLAEFYRLGIGDPVPISCSHVKGLGKLKEGISGAFPGSAPHEGEKKYLKIAIVGRPNVGKSSFVNSLLKSNRVIVSDTPGTTRDSVDTHFSYDGKDYLLIDTAGIRHKRKIKSAVDTFSIMRAKGSIKRADVALLLLDAADGVTKDDIGILDYIEETGKACQVLVNKWDLAEETEGVDREDYLRHLLYASSRLGDYPVSFISAETGKNVLESLGVVDVLNANLDQRVSTSYLNKLFEKNDPSKVPISRKKKRPNFLYFSQPGTRPVEFVIFVNDPKAVLPAHLSFIENILRDNLPLKGIPVKISIKRSRKEKK